MTRPIENDTEKVKNNTTLLLLLTSRCNAKVTFTDNVFVLYYNDYHFKKPSFMRENLLPWDDREFNILFIV